MKKKTFLTSSVSGSRWRLFIGARLRCLTADSGYECENVALLSDTHPRDAFGIGTLAAVAATNAAAVCCFFLVVVVIAATFFRNTQLSVEVA